jgi:hypothetical protein
MNRPICVECRAELRPEKNGVTVSYNNGKTCEANQGDLWRCPVCEKEIVMGIAQSPMMADYETENYYEILEKIQDSGGKVYHIFI